MPQSQNCLGLDCPYAQLGETVLWNSDSKFKECDERRENYFIANVYNPRKRHVCAYAASIVLNAKQPGKGK